MRLADEVRTKLKAFVDGNLSAHELAGWLDSVADEIHADDDPTLRRRIGQVYILLAELSYGDRTAESVRNEVETLLRQAETPKSHSAGEPDIIIPGVMPRPS